MTTEHTIDMGELHDAWRGQTITIRPYLSYAASIRIDEAASQVSSV